MLKGAYAAGRASGFTTGLVEGIEKREEERTKYVDLAIDSAKRTAPRYAAGEANAKQIEDMMYQMEEDFGISNEEFIGLVQNYDINKVYENVYAAKAVMDKNNIAGQIDKSLILGSLTLPEQINLGDNVDPAKALRMVLMGVSAHTDPNNKSESHRTGAIGKAIADMFALNPRLSAEDMIKGMQIAGVPIEQLQQFEASGGVKQKPFPQLKASGPFQGVEIDYTADNFNTTKNRFANAFARMGTNGQASDATELGKLTQDQLANTVFGAGKTKEQIYKFVDNAGMTMARLEKALIAKGLSVGFANRNVRMDVMGSIVGRVGKNLGDTQEFLSMVEQSPAVAERIVEVYGNDQMITDEELEYIMSGERTTIDDGIPVVEAPEGAMKVKPEEAPSITEQTEEALKDFDVTPDAEQQLAADEIPTVADPDVPSLREGPEGLTMFPDVVPPLNIPEDVISEDTPFTANLRKIASQNDMTVDEMLGTPGAGPRALALESMKDAWKPQMEKYTKAEWKAMDKDERRDRGLPVRPIDMWAAGSSNFKDQTPWYEAFSSRDQVEAGDAESRVDAQGNVKPEVKAAEDQEIFDDINSAILEAALEDKPTFATVFEARAYSEQWLKDNIPDYEEWMSETGYSIERVALDMFNELKAVDEPTTTPSNVDSEASSLAEELLS
jgi:hypothetical protein